MTRPSLRNLMGLAILLAGLAFYAGAVVWLAALLGTLPWFVEVLFYAVAGLAWLIPARALLQWMTRR
ncbi:MAG: DUF2842 domain-containing protein [Pseudomonadota bacterium]|jgi:hypothetical protein